MPHICSVTLSSIPRRFATKVRVLSTTSLPLIIVLISLLVLVTYMQRRKPVIYHRYGTFRYKRYFIPNVDEKIVESQQNLQSATDLHKLNNKRPDLVISIVSAYRHRVRNQYFHLTLWSILNEVRKSKDDFRVRVFICNVNSNFTRKPDYLGYLRYRLTIFNQYPPVVVRDVFEKECKDYAFCMKQSIIAAPSAKHFLIIEDDAPIRRFGSSFLPTLKHFINQAEKKGRSFAYLKLYHPPRLLGYIQPEWDRHLEVFGIVSVVMAILALIHSQCLRGNYWLTLAMRRWPLTCFYLTLLIYICDRHWVLELRSLSLYTHLLVPAPFCCTPGMVFQRETTEAIATYLNYVNCTSKYRKDYALYDYHRKSLLPAWFIQPNLLEHVGKESTLHAKKVDISNL